jgi:prolyl oligopeptidase PreP (S9A serine peptidase family)
VAVTVGRPAADTSKTLVADLHPNRNEGGHGTGKPTEKVIDERADMFGFLVRELRMTLPAGFWE